MSRPRWSEPSQCSRLGGARVWAAAVAIGSYVWSWSAKTAVRRIESMMAPPAAPRGFLRQKRASVVHALARTGCARSAAVAPAPSGLAAIAHPRVEHPVEHVDDEVREN